MTENTTRCLILACGNTLRSDDGIGPILSAWVEERFASDPSIKIICDHQWTPELSEEIAHSDSVLFIDCAIDCAPGQIMLREVQPSSLIPGLVTHHVAAPELLAITRDLYNAAPRRAMLLTVGAASIELSEGLSPAVQAVLSDVTALLELTLQQILQPR